VSIFKRISDMVRSNVNDALDKAEDPRKILEQTILDMEGEHKKARQKLLDSMTLVKQTEKQAQTLRTQANDWEQKAMAALKAGNEELARKALQEKQSSETMATEAETGVAQQKQSTEDLKAQIKNLEEKIEDAKRKKDELIQRLNAAEMQKKQAAIVSGTTPNAVNDSSAFDTFNRMVDKIENTEAEAEARKELLGTKGPEFDQELSKITKQQSADDALAALKAKMTGGPATATPAAPAATPDPKAAAIDGELEALKKKLQG
jgi:phage shock protein A